MKNQFENILKKLGFNYVYVSNFDDMYEGFEFSPILTVIMRLKFTFPPKNDDENITGYVIIEKYTISLWNRTVTFHSVIRGKSLLTEVGDIDYPFYRDILQSWEYFS